MTGISPSKCKVPKREFAGILIEPPSFSIKWRVVFIFAARAPGGSFLLPIVKLSRLTALSLLIVPAALPQLASAQDAPVPVPPTPAPVDVAPAAVEAASVETATTATAPETTPVETSPAPASTPIPGIEVNPAPDAPRPVSSGRDLPAPATQPSRLYAAQLSYNGGIVTADGSAENPVRFESGAAKLSALHIQLDTVNQTVEASGQVRLEQDRAIERRELRPAKLHKRMVNETVTETLTGQNLHYDFKNSTGTLDNAKVLMASLSITTDSLLINGKRFTASNVVVRPGALSEAETKIYGTPPFSIRAKSVDATMADKGGKNIVAVKGGSLYFHNTRILPVPSYVFQTGLANVGNGGGEEKTYQVTPGISLNSADRILLTTRLAYPIAKTPGKLVSTFDIGLSERVGARGGFGLESKNSFGQFILRARHSDIVETQLTNRIELDRKPEFTWRLPTIGSIALPGGRRAGLLLTGIYGDYVERSIGDNDSSVSATRAYGRALFTTQLKNVDGPFLQLFATTAQYGGVEAHYRSRGYTVGYEGTLLRRVRGTVSYSSTNLSGKTPFRFDEVEIAKELRSTFDVTLTPRYLLPVDLRYDISRKEFRDKTFGILRTYKTFAYGIVYQTARSDLRLEVRQGF